MIFKHDDGTVVQITVAEFAELGELYGGDVEVEKAAEAVVEGMTEATADFKVGDKVEVMGVTYVGESKHRGEIGVIRTAFKDGDSKVDIIGGGCGVYPPSSLKLVEEEPEEVLSYENVKVGELFEVIGAYGYRPFSTGTIVRMVAGVNDWHSSNFEDVLTGEQHHIPYDEIKRHTLEVLSKDNVKVGEYLVITDNSNGHRFATGEVIKAKGAHITQLKAERMDEAYWWFVYYTDVRRATDAEIAEATKSKEVKFEIGEVVKVGGSFAKVTSEIEADGDYFVKHLDNGENSYYKPSAMRHATEEEKSHLQTLIGREKDEYKVGDLVELLNGGGSGYSGRNGYIFEIDSVSQSYYHLKDNGNTSSPLGTCQPKTHIKLITPVEWRHDFVGGV